jgi:nucleotide-binding universal stress UspA family protein
MKTIVVAVDFSNATQKVLNTAGEISVAFGATLHLVHVIEPEPTYTAYGFTPEEFPAMYTFQAEARKRSAQKLDELLAALPPEVEDARTHLLEGSPLSSISKYCDDIHADMVVLGSHGHGVLASLLLGSVAEGMVRKSRVPALIVPAGPEADKLPARGL